jgi:hypothetical protein
MYLPCLEMWVLSLPGCTPTVGDTVYSSTASETAAVCVYATYSYHLAVRWCTCTVYTFSITAVYTCFMACTAVLNTAVVNYLSLLVQYV